MKRMVVILALLGGAAAAHDPDHPELNSWYRSLQANGTICCGVSDSTPLADIEWRSQDSHYQVKIDERWIDVPDNAIVRGPNLAGKTLVWVIYANGSPHVRCFLPGTMG